VTNPDGVLCSRVSDKVAKVFADSGVPVIKFGVNPTGASQEALVRVLDEIRHQGLRVSETILKEIEIQVSPTQDDRILINCPVEPTHEVRILISCPEEVDVLHWVNTVTGLRHLKGCICVSMEPIQEEHKDVPNVNR
jgi:hypothetical protein